MARTAGQLSVGAPVAPSIPPSAPARRLPGRRWRDWRLLVGVVLILASAAAGARIVGAAADTVPTWAAASDLVAGAPLREDDLVAVPVRLEAATNPYLTGPIPEGYQLIRPVAAGELVPSSALVPASQTRTTTRLVAVSLTGGAVPGPLTPGDRVDVWLVPEGIGTAGLVSADPVETGQATLLVEGVTVASVPPQDAGFGAGGEQQSAVLRLEDDAAAHSRLTDLIGTLVTASSQGRVVLTVDPTPA